MWFVGPNEPESELQVPLTATRGGSNLLSLPVITEPFSFPRKDKDLGRKGQMEASVWTVVATVWTSASRVGARGEGFGLEVGRGGGGPPLKLGPQQWERWG